MRYLRRLSGPLLDRFDLRVAVTRPVVDDLMGSTDSEPTAVVARRVQRARERSLDRIGMLPSASLDGNNKGLYEPAHGSAPDIAGKNMANPLATIMSAAMMLRYTFNQEEAARRIEAAVKKVLAQGYRTADIYETETRRVGTIEMGDAVVAALQ